MLTDIFFKNILRFIDEPFFFVIFSIIFFFFVFIITFLFLKIIFFRFSIIKSFFFWLFFFVVFTVSYFFIVIFIFPYHEKYYPKGKINFDSTLWQQNQNRYRMVLNDWDNLVKQSKTEILKKLGQPLKNINKKKFDNADLVYEISSPSFILYIRNNRTNYLNDFLGIRKKFLLIWFRENKNKIEMH